MSSGERPDPAAAGLLYQTHAQVHLGAIAANLRAIRSHVRPAQVLLAIKADGYGHGAIPVARMVQEQRLADRLGVATVPEGICLLYTSRCVYETASCTPRGWPRCGGSRRTRPCRPRDRC